VLLSGQQRLSGVRATIDIKTDLSSSASASHWHLRYGDSLAIKHFAA
jgi:hypothetical protein